MKDNPKNIDLKKIKNQIPTKYIKGLSYDRENLVIRFIQIENNKQ